MCVHVMAKVNKYDSKISVRSKGRYCVHVPKKEVLEGNLPLGTEVHVILKPKEVQQ